jgi:hypothetical protein
MITNKINGKIYIGAHKTRDLNDGYLGSGKHLSYARKKYGDNNFTKEYLKFFNTEEEMYAYEAEIVTHKFIEESTNYNIIPGGRGGWHAANTPEEITKRISTKKFRNWIIAGNEALIEKIKNDFNFKEEFCLKVSNGLISHYSNPDTPRPAPFLGKKHTQESKNKIGYKNSIANSGENNPNYNKIWISNILLKQTKLIEKECDIPEGWVIGRNKWNSICRKKDKDLKKLDRVQNRLLEIDQEKIQTEILWDNFKLSGLSIRKFYATQHLQFGMRTLFKRFKKYIPEYKDYFTK